MTNINNKVETLHELWIWIKFSIGLNGKLINVDDRKEYNSHCLQNNGNGKHLIDERTLNEWMNNSMRMINNDEKIM
jgi:hypothetical protein